MVRPAARRRRSALQTPGFVDRIDLPDDAPGRVALFSVEMPPGEPQPARDGGSRVPWAAAAWLAGVADDPLGALVLAVGLVLLLVVGLETTH